MRRRRGGSGGGGKGGGGKRRPRGRAPSFGKGQGGRLLLWALGIVVVSSCGGYLYATQVVFPEPEREVAEYRSVPDLRGMSLDEARHALHARDLETASVDSIRHPARERGAVIGQTPLPGQLARVGGGVGLTVSLGPERRPVPDVVRLRADRAITVLETTGFRVVADSVEADLPTGEIVATRPVAGTEVTIPAEIRVTVSLGPPLLPLPDLSGMQEAEARAALESLGFTVAEPVETRFRFGFSQGQVLEQFPPAGEMVPRGSAVRLVVGRRGFFEEEDR